MNVITSLAVTYLSSFIREEATSIVVTSLRKLNQKTDGNDTDEKVQNTARFFAGFGAAIELLSFGTSVVLLAASASSVPTMFAIMVIGGGVTACLAYYRKNQLTKIDNQINGLADVD